MTNAELIRKIRAEIERRVKELDEQIVDIYDSKAVLRKDELQKLLSFLDTLEEAEKPFKEPIDGVLYAAACGIKNKGQIEESEKPLPADLEEAANEYTYRGMPDEMKSYVKPVGDEVIKNFIAGAEWQKEQDDKEHSEKIAAAYQLGLADKEKQMMKEAMVVEVGMHGEPINITLDKYVQRAMGIFPGDKVRIIIVKED